MKKVLKIALFVLCFGALIIQFIVLNNTKNSADKAETQELTETDPLIDDDITEPYFATPSDLENDESKEDIIDDSDLPLSDLSDITTEPEPPAKYAPIFMYHTSSEADPNVGDYAYLYVKPSEFEKQVRYLIENGFTFCTFDDWDNLNNIEKPVFLTFDDGYKEHYTEIFPILQQYGVKITIFLIINNIAAENFTAEMIREMSDSGLVKFESLTISNQDLTAISSDNERLTREIEDSKKQIEELTGKSVLALAYPHGKFNDKVVKKAREFYLFGVGIISGMHSMDYDPYEIRRIRVNRNTSLAEFRSSMDE